MLWTVCEFYSKTNEGIKKDSLIHKLSGYLLKTKVMTILNSRTSWAWKKKIQKFRQCNVHIKYGIRKPN